MTDFTSTVAHPYPAPVGAYDHLDRLVARISAGDRLALRCLFAFLAVRVWRTAAHALPHSGHALAITRSIFLEVWHTAGAAAHYDARDWIEAITAYRVDERRRVLDERDRHGPDPGTARRRDPAVVLLDHDAHTRRELAALLGTGRATIRVSTATFIRIDDLDRALDTIASTTRRRPRDPGAATVKIALSASPSDKRVPAENNNRAAQAHVRTRAARRRGGHVGGWSGGRAGPGL